MKSTAANSPSKSIKERPVLFESVWGVELESMLNCRDVHSKPVLS